MPTKQDKAWIAAECAEPIIGMAKIMVMAHGGDNHDLCHVMTVALAVLVSKSLKEDRDIASVAALTGKVVEKNMIELHKTFALSKHVDLPNATIRKSKGLPISEEEEAALYAVGVIDKDGKLTETGVGAAEGLKNRS